MRRMLVWLLSVLILAASVTLLVGRREIAAAVLKYYKDLSAASALADTDTLLICQVVGSCGSTDPLVRATMAQVKTYIGAPGATFFVGTTAGSANTYTLASPTPAGFALTAGYAVRAAINVTNTGATTLNVNSTGATAVEMNTSGGASALVGGELQANLVYDFTYNSTCTCFIVTNLPMGAIVAGTSQTVTAAQWAAGTTFRVTTSSQTLTLPVSTSLSPNGGLVIQTIGQTATLAPNAADAINGGTTGASVTLPANMTLVVTTDGAGNISVPFPTIPVGANPTATAGASAVNGSAATFMRSDGAPALPIGTSGATIGLLNANKTDSGTNSFTGSNTFAEAHDTSYAPSLTSNNYNVVTGDCGKTLLLPTGTTPTVTLPNLNSSCSVTLVQMTSAQYTIQAASGGTLVSVNSYTKTKGQYAMVIVKIIVPSASAATWDLAGDGA